MFSYSLTEKLYISLLHAAITIKVLNSLLLCFTNNVRYVTLSYSIKYYLISMSYC